MQEGCACLLRLSPVRHASKISAKRVGNSLQRFELIGFHFAYAYHRAGGVDYPPRAGELNRNNGFFQYNGVSSGFILDIVDREEELVGLEVLRS